MKSLFIRIRNTLGNLTAGHLRASFLPLLLLLFVLYKSGFLNLPFYWDEAWSYATAVFDMHDHGITLLPGSANPELTRGHPLFFYFLSASWMKLFGTGLVAVHLLPLLLSCLLIVVLFMFCRSFFNLATAIAAVSFFALQSVFLAQSVLLLPEVLIALLVMTSVLAYFRSHHGLYVVSASLLVLTKETGVVVAAVFILDAFLIRRFYAWQEGTVRSRSVKETVYLFIPPAFFVLYVILQKIRLGWYFYPEHIGMLDFSRAAVLDKSRAFVSGLLLRNGRYLFLLAAVVSYAVLRIKGCLSASERHFLLFSLLLILSYGAFSVINFFTQRYIIPLLPLYMTTGTALITSFLSSKKMLFRLIISGFLLLFAWQTWCRQWNESDVSLGYKETVLLHKELVTYACEMKWQDKLIYSAFLMQYDLSHPRLGYLKEGAVAFLQVSNLPALPYDLYIFCSNEHDPMRERLASDDDFILLKRFERGKAWAEVYVPFPAQGETTANDTR